MSLHNSMPSQIVAGGKRIAKGSPFVDGVVKTVLFVGPETPEEFVEAQQLWSRGYAVLAINPRETGAARNFRDAGGKFLSTRIEDLSRRFGPFDLIRENYPYPSGRQYVPTEPFAQARLSRLAPGGRWVLYTESARLAGRLKAVIERCSIWAKQFAAQLKRIPCEAAPPSHYPPTDVRYQLIVRRSR